MSHVRVSDGRIDLHTRRYPMLHFRQYRRNFLYWYRYRSCTQKTGWGPVELCAGARAEEPLGGFSESELKLSPQPGTLNVTEVILPSQRASVSRKPKFESIRGSRSVSNKRFCEFIWFAVILILFCSIVVNLCISKKKRLSIFQNIHSFNHTYNYLYYCQLIYRFFHSTFQLRRPPKKHKHMPAALTTQSKW